MADRVAELTAKTRTGSATPAEMTELKGLLASGSKPTTYGTGALGVKPLKSDAEMKIELQAAAQKKLADDEIARKKELETLSRQQKPVIQREGYVFNPDTTPAGAKVDEAIKPELEKMAGGDFSSWEKTDQQKVAESMKPTGASNVGDLGDKVSAPVQAKEAAPVKEAPAVVTTESGAEIPKEEIAAAVAPEEIGGEKKDSSFGSKLKELALKYGVPLLEILQAVGYQRGGIDEPTILEQKYQEKVDARKQELMDKLETARAKRDEEASGRLLEKQQKFQEMQAVLDRLAEKEALGQKLTSEEKMLQMQLAGAKKSGNVSLIPE